ncbi:MAG: DUF6348 family protein [Asticcacaulis sp.]|uniref:DUF6348 family protein n=1 Tax=Asticcacaulis sp. TaxID=1872648 RepID=UPI0039E49FC8
MSDLPVPHIDLTPLFSAFDLIPERRGDWWLVDGLYPALRVQVTGRALTIDLALTEDMQVSETYPAEDGLSLFRDGALSLLLSAFWSRHNPGQVTRQIIRRADGPWQVLTGRYLRQVESGERPPVPYLLFGAIEAFLKDAVLAGDIHWLSIGVSVDEDGAYADARLNGARQPELEATLRALDWLYDDRDYRLRLAVLMMKV